MTTHKHNVLDLETGDITGIALSIETPAPEFLFALNENITGLSNEFGPVTTPPSIIIDNNGGIINV